MVDGVPVTVGEVRDFRAVVGGRGGPRTTELDDFRRFRETYSGDDYSPEAIHAAVTAPTTKEEGDLPGGAETAEFHPPLDEDLVQPDAIDEVGVPQT